MDKERVSNYLEDIRPTRLRIKQVEYLLQLPSHLGEIRGISFGERVSNSKIGDMTSESVVSSVDRQQSLKSELSVLNCKINLYNEWTKQLNEDYQEIIKEIYINGHTMEWLAIQKNYEASSIRSRKKRLIQILSKRPIYVTTEKEKR